MLLLLCLALAYAIQGAAKQAWADGSAAAKSGYVKTCGATKAAVKRGRASDNRAVRWGSSAAQGVGALLAGGGRLVVGTGRALWTGGRAGWEDGRRRGRRRWARRRTEQRRARQRKAEQAGDGQPGWWNYLTGTCPGCGHTPADAAALSGTCRCDALDWDCPCARRRPTRRPEPVAVSEPEPSPDLTKHPTPQPVGGDGSAASADPDNPAPTTPPEPVPTPTPTSSTTSTGDDDMTAAVQEVTTYGQARRAITGFVARATTFLDLADRAEAEADRACGEAAGLEAQAEQMAAGLSGNEFDSATIAEVNAMHERASALRAAAAKLKAAALEVRSAADSLSSASITAASGITARHSNLDEAHKSAPVRAARREGYEGD